jgi:hypothetical protein
MMRTPWSVDRRGVMHLRSTRSTLCPPARDDGEHELEHVQDFQVEKFKFQDVPAPQRFPL